MSENEINQNSEDSDKNENKEVGDQNKLDSDWSQVSKDKNKPELNLKFLLGNKFIWVIGIVIFVVLLMMIFSSDKNIAPSFQSSNKNTPIKSSDVTAELAQNLAYLKSMQACEKQNMTNTANNLGNAQVHDPSLDADHDQAMETEDQTKEMLARQNAPTNMLSNGAGDSANSNNNAQQFSSASPSNIRNNQNNSSNTGSTNNPSNTNQIFSGQGVNTSFANQSMNSSVVSAQKIAHPDYTIASGEFLHAVLETAIDSDLPGEIRAVVSEPVYAYIGETPLIPAGSRLIGQYSSSVQEGQDRVFVVWNRVILPDGTSAQINSPGVDGLGTAGQSADAVDTHFFARFGEASLLSIIGAGAANGGVSTSDQYNSASQYRSAIAQSFQQSANNSLQGTLPTAPTLSIDQGAAINVFVAHDIDFYSVLNNSKES